MFKCVTVDSHASSAVRKSSLDAFNEDPDCNVLLLTTGIAATGLTLTIAHVCYMLEPTHNAAIEAQVGG